MNYHFAVVTMKWEGMKTQNLDRKSRLVKHRKAVREAPEWDRRRLWIRQLTSIRLAMWPIKWSVEWAMSLEKDWGVWEANSVGHPLGSNKKKNNKLTRFEKWKETWWKASAIELHLTIIVDLYSFRFPHYPSTHLSTPFTHSHSWPSEWSNKMYSLKQKCQSN